MKRVMSNSSNIEDTPDFYIDRLNSEIYKAIQDAIHLDRVTDGMDESIKKRVKVISKSLRTVDNNLATLELKLGEVE